MDNKNDFPNIDSDYRNPYIYAQTIQCLKEIFLKKEKKLHKVIELACRVRAGLEKISPIIQKNTRTVCPGCREVCCISKHGYHNYEDLVYLCALGLNPPMHESGRRDSDPCRFLTETGCCMERSVRPSGCNWYFCDPLLEHMEKSAEYHQFDESLRDVAELWMKMMEEFRNVQDETCTK